jgi:hypothetical protein
MLALGLFAPSFPLHRLCGVLRSALVLEPANHRNFTVITAMFYQQKNVVHTYAFLLIKTGPLFGLY